ncbi:hypothetical protein HAX54_046902, partial [Datura stramonium]|nr:hypothetical protein [Datura stramonium]
QGTIAPVLPSSSCSNFSLKSTFQAKALYHDEKRGFVKPFCQSGSFLVEPDRTFDRTTSPRAPHLEEPKWPTSCQAGSCNESKPLP